mgnify:CR=1 FL=1
MLQPQAADDTPLPELDLGLERLYRDLPKVRHNYLRVVDFDDPRFSAQRTAQGAWQPLDFLSEVGYGLYVLEPWSPDKEPIVLLHGINDSPRVWRELAAGIDRTRYQLLLFHYPSGMPLNNSAYLLSEAEQQGSMTFTIPFSRIQLADYLNCDRSALSRELSLMQRDGLLTCRRSSFCLLCEF